MKRKLTILLVGLFLLCLREIAFASESLRYVVFGDCRGRTYPEPINLSVLNPMVSKIAGLNPSPKFVLFLGDIAWTADPKQLEVFKEATSPITTKGIPVYVAIGNHEIRKIRPPLLGQQAFQAAFDMPKNGPSGYEELAYWFEYQDTLFVCIDSFYVDPKRPDITCYNMLTKEQLVWLDRVLKNSKKKFKFVFSHAPAFPVFSQDVLSYDSWEEAWEILDRHKVDIYFCGHEHLYSRWKIDGVIQIISGGAGAPLPRKTAVPTANPDVYKSSFNYVVVDITDNNLKLEAFDLENNKIDALNINKNEIK